MEKLFVYNIPSSFVSSRMKLADEKGSGEAKLWIGSTSKATEIDSFFSFDSGYTYAFERTNLLNYLQQVRIEYIYQLFNKYKDANLTSWENMYSKLENCHDDYFTISLTKYTDATSRYYIKCNNDIWSDFRSIAVPKITNVVFEKDSVARTITIKLAICSNALPNDSAAILTFKELYDNVFVKKIVSAIKPGAVTSKLNTDDVKTVNDALELSGKSQIKNFSIITPSKQTTANSAQQAFVELISELYSIKSAAKKLIDLDWFHDEARVKEVTSPEKRYGRIDTEHFVFKDAEVTLLMIRSVKAVLDSLGEDSLGKYSFSFQRKNLTPPLEYQEDIAHEGIQRTILPPAEALEHIKSYIAAKGFTYPPNMIENFYLSLKSKPFVILAGTSGTGKTRLVKLFAEAINASYLPVAVRPDWSDSSDLFGHLNLQDTFIPGALTDFIAEASLTENADTPYLLCLDEMNLARVEYYLSDVLSIIETRDRRDDGRIGTDALLNDSQFGTDNSARKKYSGLQLPDNLYIIGTVNMDETTFPFSKKVLDRANTIEFSYVDLNKPFEDAIADDVKPLSLHNDVLKTEYLYLKDCLPMQYMVNRYCDKLQEINEVLKKANAHVGFRVRDEICFYLLNAETIGMVESKAMDFEIMQKILPRIQGSSSQIRRLLIDMFKICAVSVSQDTDSIADAMDKWLIANQKKYPEGTYPNSAAKIAFMMRCLEDDGFTSYWI